MRLASLVALFTCKGAAPKSPWVLGVVLAGMLVVGLPTRAVLADTILNSGTTTVSTGTYFGNNLYVATTGTATLEVIAGGSATNTRAYLGYDAGGVGVATVSSGTWANSDFLIVGNSGAGTLNVAGGSVTSDYGRIGLLAGSIGTATVSGSGTWTNSTELDVGSFGTGTLNVTGGSILNGAGYIGRFAGSIGEATVSGGTWSNGGSLVVGQDGTGTLNVNGGLTSSAVGVLGFNVSGVGTATLSSGTWANSGNLYVGLDGTGTLNLNGGLVSVAGTLSTGTSGTINLNAGGTLQIGVGGTTGVLGVSTLTNNGTLIFNRSDASTYSGIISGTGAVTKQGAGMLTFDGANSYSGGTKILSGAVSVVTGGSIDQPNANMIVGQSGGDSGSLNVTGGLVNNSRSYLGYDAGSNGTATVSSGTWANSGEFYVGYGGTGVLAISGSGVVTNSNAYVGYEAGSVGTATVSSGTWANSGNLTVGDSGTGTLTMSGGLVTVGGTLSRGTYGTINLNSGGTLSPGNSPGVLTVGSLSLSDGSTTLMEINNTSLYDQIVGTGTLTYGGNLDLVISGSYANGTTFNLFSNFSTKTLDFADVGLDATGEYASLTFTGTDGVWTSTWTTNQQRLVFSTTTGNLVVVPEPSTVAMALAGLACGGWQMMRRRRLRKAATLAA